MASQLYSFRLSEKHDADLVGLIDNLPSRERSQFIRDALREYQGLNFNQDLVEALVRVVDLVATRQGVTVQTIAEDTGISPALLADLQSQVMVHRE